ncbi:DUF7521 family protein [Halohasta litorea]|uniref:Uncharacterized protein n=1 Tax=Halohasta litorea TaxID=869891 RepID=A0ABD6DBD7_9EURY|nr:hypothetical protein [Halohasta litorea]
MLGRETTLYLVLLASTLLALALGLTIVFQAYRGYRRNDSTRMLYLAVGLGFVTIAPFGLSLGFALLTPFVPNATGLRVSVLPLLRRLLEITGLGLILYSLYSPRLGGSV